MEPVLSYLSILADVSQCIANELTNIESHHALNSFVFILAWVDPLAGLGVCSKLSPCYVMTACAWTKKF